MAKAFCRDKRKSTDFLFDFEKYLNENDRHKNLDFIKIFNYLMTCFSRNSLRKDLYLYKKGKKFDFDYQIMEENGSMEDLLSIQRQLPYFRSNMRIANIDTFINEYIDFMNESLKKLCTTIYLPVKGISYEYMGLINKYRDYFEEHKIHKKSPKLNYEVLAQLGISLDHHI